MNSDRWLEIKTLLAEALELPPRERETFLEGRCGDDHELRSEVDAYLSFEDEELEVFEQPLVDLLAGRDPELHVGKRVGPFELVSEIARGGMGVVYRAERVEGDFQQTVAVKLLKHGFDRGDFIRRSRQERRILARLDHPYVARLLDGGATEEGLPYLVMELVEGERLDLYCESRSLGLAERLDLFLRICEVVRLAHQHLIVHCDLKPSNILVTAEGEPKLLDFGIAKVLREDSGTRTLALRLGTPGYASPEQMAGGDVSTAADLYALGGLLYLLLSGKAPRMPKGPEERLTEPLEALGRLPAKDSDGELAARRAALRKASEDLQAIVGKAMAWEPAKRYGSVGELIDDLRRHLDRRPISARSYSWWGDLKLTARRRRRELRIASAVLLTVFLAAFAGLRLRLEAQLAATRAEETLSAYEEILRVIDPTNDEPEVEAVRSAVAKLEWMKEMRDPVDRAFLLDRVGRFLVRNGFDAEARPLLAEALELRREHQPEDWEKVAASQNNLALVDKALGAVEEATELWGELRALHERHRGDEAFDRGEYLEVLSNLARGKQTLGLFEEAVALDRQVLAGKIELHGDEAPETTESRSNLGQLLVRMGRWDEAEPLLERVVEVRQRELGPAADRTLLARSNLAALWLTRGETDRAIEAYREVLQRREKIYAPDHPKVATSRAALGRALLERGSEEALQEAERLLAEALRAFSAREQEAGATALWIRRHLASLRLAQGHPEEAEAILRAVLEVEPWTGRGHWRGAEVRSLLGECLLARGALAEARAFLEETWPVIAETTGEDSLYAREARRRWRLWLEARDRQGAPTAAPSKLSRSSPPGRCGVRGSFFSAGLGFSYPLFRFRFGK